MIYPETGGHNLFHQNFSTNHRKLNFFVIDAAFHSTSEMGSA